MTKTTQPKHTIVIVEDHTILRDGLRAILSDYEEFVVTGEAADGIEGVRCVTRLKPDLVLLDLSMPRMNGLDALSEMKRNCPRTRVLILSIHHSEMQCLTALRAGADGYALKDSKQCELLEAIRTILAGKRYISPGLGGRLSDAEALPDQCPDFKASKELLTKREKQILKMIAEGHSNKQIAELLYISPKTVDNHRTNLMGKLDLHSVQDLTRYAAREKIVDDL